MKKAVKVEGIQFQLGASFKGEETMCLLLTDGTVRYFPLAKSFIKELKASDIETHGTFGVEG